MARASEKQPVYVVKNILFNGSAFDTGVLLAKEGSSGYTVFLKFDSSQSTDVHSNFLQGTGFYEYYYFFYANNAHAVWGRKGIQPSREVRNLPSSDRPKWINTLVLSFNFDTRTEIVAFNNYIRTGNMNESNASTETLKINPSNRTDGLIVEEMRIYDYPMTVSDVEKLINS